MSSDKSRKAPSEQKNSVPAAGRMSLNDYWPAAEEDTGGQDMIRTLSELNDRIADEEETKVSSVVRNSEEKSLRVARRRDAEELIVGMKVSAENGDPLHTGEEMVLSAGEAAALAGELGRLGLRGEEAERILTAFCRESLPPEKAEASSEENAAPLSKVTDRSVELNLEGRPARLVRVVSEENGHYLIVESDQEETRIRLPF